VLKEVHDDIRTSRKEDDGRVIDMTTTRTSVKFYTRDCCAHDNVMDNVSNEIKDLYDEMRKKQRLSIVSDTIIQDVLDKPINSSDIRKSSRRSRNNH